MCLNLSLVCEVSYALYLHSYDLIKKKKQRKTEINEKIETEEMHEEWDSLTNSFSGGQRREHDSFPAL